MTRLIPPYLAVTCLAAMGILRFVVPQPVLAPFPYDLLGVAPTALGIWLLLAGSGRFARLGTNINTFNEPGQLVTDGLFRWSRNPMYVGFVLTLAGAATLLGAAWGFAPALVFLAAANFWYIPFEERALTAKFGDAYQAYRRQTRRWV